VQNGPIQSSLVVLLVHRLARLIGSPTKLKGFQTDQLCPEDLYSFLASFETREQLHAQLALATTSSPGNTQRMLSSVPSGRKVYRLQSVLHTAGKHPIRSGVLDRHARLYTQNRRLHRASGQLPSPPKP
jgi:hypothetical protein